MYNNEIADKRFKRDVAIILVVLIGILIFWAISRIYNYFNVIPNDKIILDIGKRVGNEGSNRIDMKGTKVIDNKKIVVFEFSEQDITIGDMRYMKKLEVIVLFTIHFIHIHIKPKLEQMLEPM